MFLVAICFTHPHIYDSSHGSNSNHCAKTHLLFIQNASQSATHWYCFVDLSALIHNLGFGCNWWWTLGSSWYCAGRDCNGYQKIVNRYLLLFNFWISFGFHRGNFWCKLVDWFFCTLPVLNVSWLWMFFGQDWVKLERIGDMYTR
jgi:hypothetical protein